MRAAICDDNAQFIQLFLFQLEKECQRLSLKLTMECFTNPEELLKSHRLMPYTILFLDIEMPVANGFEVAHSLHEIDKSCSIVFVSHKNQLVYQSFEYSPFAFLRKSHISQELPSIMKRLSNVYSTDTQVISYKRKAVSVNLSDIIYIESNQNFVILHTTSENYRIKESTSSWEKRTVDYYFIRTHASYLVNCRYIYTILKEHLVLLNGEELPISRQKQKEVREGFTKYMEAIS